MQLNDFLTIAKRIVRIVIPLGVGLFLGWQIYTNWQQIAPQIAHANIWLLVAAFFTNIMLYPLWLLGWHLILRELGQKISFRSSFGIGIMANFAKYIPGLVWQYLGRIELARQAGIPRPVALTSLAYEILIYLIAGGVWTLLYFGKTTSAAGLAGAVLLFFSMPKILAVLRARINRFKDLPTTTISLPSIILIFFLNLLDFFATGLAIWFILASFGPPAVDPIRLTAIYAFAWIVGYLTFLAPGGLGVADLTLTGFLTPFLGIGLASLVAVVLRVIILGNELLLGLVTLKLWKNSKS